MKIVIPFKLDPMEALKFNYNNLEEEITIYIKRVLDKNDYLTQLLIQELLKYNDEKLVDKIEQYLNRLDVEVFLNKVRILTDTIRFNKFYDPDEIEYLVDVMVDLNLLLNHVVPAEVVSQISDK